MQLSRVNRSVADRLHSAAIRLLRRLRREDDAMGLTAARASALSVLVFGGRPITLGALAQAEQVSAEQRCQSCQYHPPAPEPPSSRGEK